MSGTLLVALIGTALCAPFDSQGHRGARGLFPENTIPSFTEALNHGMTTLELDTTLTKDGRLIVHHDTQTNPSICLSALQEPIESQPIRQLTADYLGTLECGLLPQERFPEQQQLAGAHPLPLDDLLQQIEEIGAEKGLQPQYNIELKFPKDVPAEDVSQAVDRVLMVLKDTGLAQRSTIQSFHLPALELVHQRAPQQQLSALFYTTRKLYIKQRLGMRGHQRSCINKAVELDAGTVSPHYSLVDRTFIKQAHEANLKVVPWTVNETATMNKLIKLGVDGLISDYPDRLAAALKTHTE